MKRIKRLLALGIGVIALAASFVLMAMLGLAAVIIPAGVRILAMGLARARRWLRDPARLLARRNNLLSKETV